MSWDLTDKSTYDALVQQSIIITSARLVWSRIQLKWDWRAARCSSPRAGAIMWSCFGNGGVMDDSCMVRASSSVRLSKPLASHICRCFVDDD